MRRTSFAAGLAITAVAFVAIVGAEWPDQGAAEICEPGYSKAHRMPYAQSAAIKRGMTTRPQDYELDHIIPLCLGGSNSSSNLMLQPWDEAKKKDRLEVWACKAVCGGRLPLAAGRRLFVDWKQGYFDTFGERP